MRGGIFISALAHSALLALGVVSFSSVEKHETQDVAAIDIELVPVEEISNVRKGAADSKVIETPAPSPVEAPPEKAPEEPTGEVEKEQPKSEVVAEKSPAPTVSTAPKPVIRKPTQITPLEEAASEPEKEPEPVKKVEEVKEVVAPEASKEPTVAAPKLRLADTAVSAKRKAYAKKQADKISDIINEEKSRGTKQGSGAEKSAGSATGTAARLTKSERDALAAQMRKCWNPPVAALERDDLLIRVVVDLNKDGSVDHTASIVKGTPGQLEKSMIFAAQRAVRRCAPYTLNPEKYEEWRQVDVTFDPKDLR